MLDRISKRVDGRRPPLLVTIVIGRRPDSLLYVRLKEAAAARLGIRTEQIRLPSATAQHRLISIIKKLNRRPDVNGILLQLPLPSHIETEAVVNSIDRHKDIDGLRSDSPFQPPFLLAMVHLLRLSGVRPTSVVILAAPSPLRERLEKMLGRSSTVSTDSARHRIPSSTKKVGAVITFRGHGPRLTGRDITNNTVVIDGGIRRHEGQTVGDASRSVLGVAKAMTPVPGGVGPLTIAYLLDNLTKGHKK